METIIPETVHTNTKALEAYFHIAKHSGLFRDFYKNVMHYQEAPVMYKKELVPILQEKFDIHAEQTGVYLVRSGGSTQQPLIFPVDIAENHQQRQALAAALSSAGIFTPTTVALNLFGYTDMYRTAAILDDILEKCQATTLSMSAHATYEDMENSAWHFRPSIMMGTPSKLLLLARYLEEKGATFHIPHLLFAGEFLRPSFIDFFKKVFHTESVFSLYGSAETGIWAWSEYSKHPSLFRMIEGIVIEIFHPDTDGYGTIAVTNLFRKRFPVFRYAIGDVGRLVMQNGIQYLELKARESKSFLMCETHYQLDDLLPVIEGAELFQVQLSTTDTLMDKLTLLVVQEIPEHEQAAFILEKTEALKKIFAPYADTGKVVVQVQLVPASGLYTDRTTSKTPQLLDRRR